MTVIPMPRLSDSMEEGTIVRWLVEDGAAVDVGQELVEIETDKAVMVYEAEAAGTLAVTVEAGETVKVGSAIGELHRAGQVAARAEVPAPVEDAASAPSAAGPSSAAPSLIARPPTGVARPPATPVARRIAVARGVELPTLTGTGPRGRIVKRDVLAAVAEGATESASGAVVEGARGATTVEPASRVQQLIARRMAEAKATQPDFTISVEIDMGAALDLRARLKQAAEELSAPPPSVNDLVVKAVALALRRHPRANGAYVDGSFELYGRVNVGLAVAAGETLLVPVVADVDRISLGALAARTAELATKGRDGKLTAPELAGATFTVSNLGMFGVTAFTAILNTPQAAILAVGAVRETPIVLDGELAIGRRMTATLTCDHRILYGAEAAAFLAEVRARLESPYGLLLSGGTQ